MHVASPDKVNEAFCGSVELLRRSQTAERLTFQRFDLVRLIRPPASMISRMNGGNG